ncbi:MAG: hypothetical protein IKG95_00510 [Bacteroidales bacterium]|nr:hypothetical protein [Bacteroidales bacterium]
MIEFDGFYRILSNFAEMLKNEFGMKKHIPLTGIWIAVVLLALMVACDPPKEKEVEPMEKPLPELAAIDSLMWKQPDSAFAMLQEFVVSQEAKDLDVFNEHYCQLLISELLYKKDYEQSNREALLEAVVYFDSLTEGIRDTDTRGVSLRERNVFLNARVHYINGVGYYEQGDVVQACAEYLKVLEMMEAGFEEKDLVKQKAQFMSYTYNRLGGLFSSQFMMEPAILCYKEAQVFCMIEQTSPYGISNNYYRIGIQYNKMGQQDTAMYYYERAIDCLADSNNLVYRNIATNKSLLYYQISKDAELAIQNLKSITKQSANESERLSRYLTIGDIYYEVGNYDSAKFYLEQVFEKKVDEISKIQAAECLRNVYDSIGEFGRADVYVHYLADHKKSEGENKALTSRLEGMFKTYMDQKQQKKVEEMREKSIMKTVKVIVPNAIILALAVFVVAKLRSKKLLKKQQEEADRILGETEQEHEKELRLWQAEADKTLEETKKKYEEELRQMKAETEQRLEEVERKHQQWMAEARERHEEELRTQKDRSEKEIEKTKKRHVKELEAERLAYEKEQDALRQNLKEKEAQVIALEKTLNLQQKAAKQRRMAFLNEPICQHILDKARSKQITTRDVAHELGIALKDKDFEQLGEAVEKHYEGFDHELLSQCPSLKQGLLSLCHLHLLGLNESEIAALKNLSYSAIKKQNESLQEKLGVNEDMASYILRVAEGLCGTQNGTQGGTQTNESIDDDLDAWIERQIKDNPKITTEELAEKSHKGVRTIKRHISMMGHIHYVGSGYSGHWEVVE